MMFIVFDELSCAQKRWLLRPMQVRYAGGLSLVRCGKRFCRSIGTSREGVVYALTAWCPSKLMKFLPQAFAMRASEQRTFKPKKQYSVVHQLKLYPRLFNLAATEN
jgi:hypothetical protein